jgi:hypothetical protein
MCDLEGCTVRLTRRVSRKEDMKLNLNKEENVGVAPRRKSGPVGRD